jgi:hypothetical protein
MTALHSRDEHTLAAVFGHPLQHNIHWRDVLHLCQAIGGEVQVLRDQRLHLRLPTGEHQIWMHTHVQPGRGTLQEDEVLQLRRFLKLAGITPAGDAGGAGETRATEPAAGDRPLRLVIRLDHRLADVYQLIDDRIQHIHLRPHGLWGEDQNLSHRHERDIAGQRAPLDKAYLRQIGNVLEQADQVVLCGHGHGQADVVQLLLQELRTHRPDLLARVIATVRLDDPALSERQLLQLAAQHFDSEAQRPDAAEPPRKS